MIQVQINPNECVICRQIAPPVNNTIELNELSSSGQFFENLSPEIILERYLLKLLEIKIQPPKINEHNPKKTNAVNNDLEGLKDIQNPEENQNQNHELKSPASSYCSQCFARNHEIFNIFTQIYQLNKCLEKLKGVVETEFRKSFSLQEPGVKNELPETGSCSVEQVFQRSKYVRFEIARALNLIPKPEEDLLEPYPYVDDYYSSPDVSENINVEPEPISENQSCRKIEEPSIPVITSIPEPELNELSELNELNPDPPDTDLKKLHKLKDLSIMVQKLPNKGTNPKIQSRSPTNSTVYGFQLYYQLTKNIPDVLSAPSMKTNKKKIMSSPKIGKTSRKTKNALPKKKEVVGRSVKLAKGKRLKLAKIPGDETKVDFSKDSEKDQKQDGIEKDEQGEVERRRNKVSKLKKGPPTNSDMKTSKTKSEDRPRIYCPVEGCIRGRLYPFKSDRDMECHRLKVHEGVERPYQCSECSLCFPKDGERKYHYRNVHLNIRKYVCHVCGNSFTNTTNLDLHLHTHTEERPLECGVCGKGFKHPRYLTLHRRSVHEKERSFKCDRCGKGFFSGTKMNNHIKSVHFPEERPHICEICGKGFPIYAYLHLHKRMHKESEGRDDGLDGGVRKRRKREKHEDDSGPLDVVVVTSSGVSSQINSDVDAGAGVTGGNQGWEAVGCANNNGS